jgi:hypothetical protein
MLNIPKEARETNRINKRERKKTFLHGAKKTGNPAAATKPKTAPPIALIPGFSSSEFDKVRAALENPKFP